MTNLQHNDCTKPKNQAVYINLLACLFLYAYLAVSSLSYISWIPAILNTITLYGFIAVGIIATLITKRYLTFRIHTIWYFAFFIICLASCLYSKNVNISFSTTVDLIKILIFSFVVSNVVDSHNKIKMCMGTYSLGAIGLYIHLLVTDQLIMEEGERLGNELTGNANAFASIFMVAAMFSVYFLFFAERRLTKLLYFVCLCLQLYSLALSGGRKFFVLPIVLMCSMKLISTDKRGRKHFIRNGLIVAAILYLVFSAIFYVEDLYNSIGYRMEGMLNMLTGEGAVEHSAQTRNQMIIDALALWEKAPIFGHGINMFQILESYGTYSHNNYTELLSGIGLIGFLLYYAFHAVVLYQLIKNKARSRWYWLFLILCLLVFDYGAVSYNMFMIHFLFVICLMDVEFFPIQNQNEKEKS